MATTTKTAVSLDRELYSQAQAVATELGVNRSRLFSMALEEFLRRYENHRLLQRINEACAKSADDEDNVVLDGMMAEIARQGDSEW